MSVQKLKDDSIDYSAISKSQEFKNLLAVKKGFIVPLSIFFFVFFFTLPIMTAYTTVLNNPAFGSITWAWVFAFAEFIMTWTLVTLYTKKAAGFDKLVDQIINKAIKRR